MANKLKQLSVNEGSLVDKGANDGALVMLFKRDEPKTISERISGFFTKMMMGHEVEAKDFDTAYSERTRQDEMWKLDDALRQSICSILDDEELTDKRKPVGEALQQYYNALIDTGIMKAGKKISGSRMRTLKELKAMMDKGAAVMQAMMDEVEGKMPDEMEGKEMKKGSDSMADETTDTPVTDEPVETTDSEDIAKAMVDLQKRLEDAEKRAQDAENIAKAEKELRVQKEYEDKAKDLSNIGSVEDVAKMLRTAYEVSEENGSKLEETLKAASARIDITKEIGSDSPDESSAEGKLEKLAKALAEKDGITYEKAYTKVLKSAEGIALQAELSREVN